MTNAEARFNKSLRPRKPEGSLGRTAQDGHLDSHTAPELCIDDRLYDRLYSAILRSLEQTFTCRLSLACGSTDDELMLNVLRCHLTY